MAIINLDDREKFTDEQNQDDNSAKPDKSLFSRLKKLFSNDVIVRNVGGKKLKIVDTDNVFLGTDKNSLRDRYNRVRSSTALSNRDMNMSYQAARLELFRDYDVMDNDSIISSALDVYSDECTTQNELGDILTIKSDNENVKQILHNLFYDILNLDFNLWSWTRNMCKYGDFFLRLEISPEYGIYGVTPCSAYEINRIENSDPNNPNYVKFQHEGSFGGGEYEAFEIAHFRLIGDANFLPYGKSMIEGARRVWKQLSLMEDGMLIHRIMRAPEKRIFKVDVGNIPPADIDAYMEKVMAKIKKVPYIDERTGDYNLRFNLQNMIEDFYLPVRGGDSGTSIDTLDGMEFTGIEDIEYLRNKMLAALKIPKAFLGFEESLSGRATLSAQDIRFARTITRIQKILISELKKIAIIHLYAQGFTDASLVNFDLELTNPSTIYEQEKIALWADKISLTKDLLDSKMFSKKWIYTNIFEFSDHDATQMQHDIIEDIKQGWRQSQIETEGNDPATSGQKVNSDGSTEEHGDGGGGGGGGSDVGGSFSGGNDGGGDTGEGGDPFNTNPEGGDTGGEGNDAADNGDDEDKDDLSEDTHHGLKDPDEEKEQRKKDAEKKWDDLKGRGTVEDPLGKLSMKQDLSAKKSDLKSKGLQTRSIQDALSLMKAKLGKGVPPSTLLTEESVLDYLDSEKGANKGSFMDDANILED